MVWGARTLHGADDLADPYRYVPVRRTALFLEESLSRGLAWAVFEPNDERLWARIRRTVGGFLQDLFRQGAFGQGRVVVLVGFAPVRPAEFVVLRMALAAG